MLKFGVFLCLIGNFLLSDLWAQEPQTQDTSVHDLGQFGPTYPIAEQDFLEYLQQKIHKLSESGTLLEHQKNLIKKSEKSVTHPTPVQNIRKTTNPRVYYIDPALILKNDIVLPDGKILAKKGDAFNPLAIRGLSKPILFLDGGDEEQVAWARKEVKNAVWILVNGSPIELSQKEKRAVYFDQGGAYSKKWNIRQVPARVTQEGLKLKIEEVLP